MDTQVIVAFVLGMAAPALAAVVVRLWGVPGERKLPAVVLPAITVSVASVCSWRLLRLELPQNRLVLCCISAVTLICTMVLCAALLRRRLHAHWLLAREHWSRDEVAQALQLIVRFYRAPDVQFRLRVQWVAGRSATKDEPARMAQLRVYINATQKWCRTPEVGRDDEVILHIGRTFGYRGELALAKETDVELIWVPGAQNPDFELHHEPVVAVA